jgi:hypothetical protein
MVLFAGSAFAEDFVFKVPVETKNLCPDINNSPPGANKIRVYCKVKANDSSYIGSSYSEATMTNGNMSRTIEIKFNASPGKDPSKAATYECSLSIFYSTEMGPGFAPAEEYMKPNGACPKKPGTLFRTVTNGVIQKRRIRL